MTKILVVDDEPAQSRGLLRAILLRRPEYSVLTACSGMEAIAVLEEQHVDLVITDLQMSEMDGFDFLAWLLSHRPSVVAFAMTAYATEETHARLSALGSVECFSKPLDIDQLVLRVSEGLAQNIRGHVHNVGLASFLQLVELEKKTCTLEVRSEGHVGQLFLRKGELLDAHTAALGGEEAAVAILGWMNVSIAIDSSCNVAQRVISKPAYYMVMEAMRVRDESIRPRPRASDAPAPGKALGSSLPPLRSDFPGRIASDRPVSMPRTARLARETVEALHVPVGALALAVVEMVTGYVLTVREQPDLKLPELVEGALTVLRQQRTTLGLAAGGTAEALEEVVMMTASRGELLKPLPEGDAFVLLVFDTSETNLVMARLELELFMAEYRAA